jgi:hypothetical protein
VLATLAAGFGSALAIIGKVALTVRLAVLATLAARLCCFLAVIREISRAVLAANLAGARRLLAVLGKVARISGMSLIRH